jgi:hypothetical protein
VLDYLGRYTHRVALSNDRIVKVENGEVTWLNAANFSILIRLCPGAPANQPKTCC